MLEKDLPRRMLHDDESGTERKASDPESFYLRAASDLCHASPDTSREVTAV